MRYLLKYKNKYRVLAHYDQNTNDFPRDSSGNIDPTFDDLYIPCCKGQIYHYDRSILVACVMSAHKGKNICNKLNEIDSSIIFDYEETDKEVFFKFNSKHMDIVASKDIMGAKIYGCDISPFSTKNLPKRKYAIPKEDLEKYADLIKDINIKDNMYLIRKLFIDFDKVITKHMKKSNKQFDVNAEKKARMLKGKEFIHDIGMWNEFIDYININIKTM